MRAKVVLSCLLMAILGVFSVTASAAWQCTAWNPTLHLRWTSDLSGDRDHASYQVSTECASVSNYQDTGECYTSCSKVERIGTLNPNFYTPKSSPIMVNANGSGLGQTDVVMARVCSVSDRKGRVWTRESTGANACTLALNACENAHLKHHIYGGGSCRVMR